MSKKDSKIGVCVYCGKEAIITRDHIPPKNLFGEPRPSNLISVPSCFDCNSGFSKDDEYFRFSFSIREDIFDNVQDIYPKVMRSLQKPTKIGFRNNFLKTIKPVEDISDAGIFCGYKYSYDVNLSRLNKVAERIIKGLFYYHFKEIIPNGYKVKAYCSEGMRYMIPSNIIKLQDNILSPLSKQKLYDVRPIFEYKFITNKKDKFMSVWLLSFWQKVYFVGFTLPANKKV